MQLKNMKLGLRLGFGFAAVLMLMIGMAAVGAIRLNEIVFLNTKLNADSDRQTLALQWKGETRLNLMRTMAIGKSGNQAELTAYLQPQMKDTSAQITELQKKLESMVTSESEKKLMETIAERRKAYVGIRNSIFDAFKAGDSAGAQARLDSELAPASDAYLAAITALADYLGNELATDSPLLEAKASQGRFLLLGLAMAALLVGGVLAWLITRSVTQPLARAIDATRSVAQGDLSQPINNDRRDEVGQLLQTLADMQNSLRQMVSGIRQTTESITTASTEIAAGNQDLSGRTEQTASSLQQTASSMEQLTGTVKQTADSARTANQLVSSASASAAKGGEVVSEVVATMDEITASSRKIADIIGVIDGIAFQTNILALNAAVEAARAGEQGRGFAVVAGEVRSLAQRSAEAAKEIKSLIGASVERVETGSKLVQDAGSTMAEIVASVKRVNDIIGEITAAASEQSDGIGQVNTAVTQLDQMTQQNAALVEESAAAAESLKGQAYKLADVVGRFRLSTEATWHARFQAQAQAQAKVEPAKAPPKPAAAEVKPTALAASPAAAPVAAPLAAPMVSVPAAAGDDWETF
ncbi:methyl-accepting chemotaxis protein [Methylibium rhizosphaerae]|uniref:methyl-accepting chemotaxis protein n=1 Tax=Methylibium rhizosphaerae TaxID=2570323 RepID=UPI00112C39E7|nr:methyl-accepting chemotaxis protein [Methylibium rhizosphaerae]